MCRRQPVIAAPGWWARQWPKYRSKTRRLIGSCFRSGLNYDLSSDGHRLYVCPYCTMTRFKPPIKQACRDQMRQRGDTTWHLALPCVRHIALFPKCTASSDGRELDDLYAPSICSRPCPISTLSLSNKTQRSLTNNAPSLLHILLSFCFLLCDLAPVCTNKGFVDQSSPSFEHFTSSPAVERFNHYYFTNYFANYGI